MIPDNPILFWQYFDLYTLTVLTITIGILIFLHRQKHGSFLSTISKTIAHSKKSSLTFSTVMTICFPLYYAFIWFWVAPLYQMPDFFYYLIIFSAICEAVFVWVPAIQGRKNTIHQLAAGVVGVFMLIMPILVLAYADGLALISTITIFIFLISSAILAALFYSKKYRSYSFTLEFLYLIIFLATISIIAHS